MKIQTKKIIAREFLVFIFSVSIALISYLIMSSHNYFKQKEEDKLSEQILSNTNLSDSLSKPLNTKMASQLSFSNKYYNLYYSSDKDNILNFYDDNGMPIVGHNKSRHAIKPFELLSQNKTNKTSNFYSEKGVPIMGNIWNLHIFEHLKYLSQIDSIPFVWKDTKDFEDFGRHFEFAAHIDFKRVVDANIITEGDVFANTKADSIEAQVKFLQLKKDSVRDKIIPSEKQLNLFYLIFLYSFLTLFPLRYLLYGIKWSFRTLKQK